MKKQDYKPLEVQVATERPNDEAFNKLRLITSSGYIYTLQDVLEEQEPSIIYQYADYIYVILYEMSPSGVLPSFELTIKHRSE